MDDMQDQQGALPELQSAVGDPGVPAQAPLLACLPVLQGMSSLRPLPAMPFIAAAAAGRAAVVHFSHEYDRAPHVTGQIFISDMTS